MAEKILSNLTRFKEILPIIRHHHEAFDGSGYPDALKGTKIPFGARVLCIVDSFDAMTSARSDRPAMSTEEALGVIVKNAGRLFDKELVSKFVEFIRSTAGAFNGEIEAKDKGGVQKLVGRIVQRFKNGNIDLPVLPKVIQEIQNMISQPKSTANDMARVIEKDTVISIKLISVANSPMYRGTENIYSVKQAIPRLGFKETRSIVTAISNKSLYETKNEQFRMLMEKLWLHSLACAHGSKIIADKLRLADSEQLFIFGLVHDIGKPPLLKVLSEKISPNKSPTMTDIIASIQQVHTGFGKIILEHWGFTQEFSRIAVGHEGPNFTQATEKAILVVNLANNISRKIGYSLFDDAVDLMDLESTKLLKIAPDTLDAISEETVTMMQNTVHMF
jgi:HD-like signal output (HDOD) protein